jgi:hypothetical protein
MMVNFLIRFVSLILFFIQSESFSLLHMNSFSTKLCSHGMHGDGKVAVNSPVGNSVSVYKSSESLGAALCNDFVLSAQNAISRSGRFYVAVPGGSVLKMLGDLNALRNDVEWNKG